MRMSDAGLSLNETFKALCLGYAPFRWQRRLFDWLADGNIPPSCSLPTGLGKTSIIPIWLIALAHSARKNSTEAPLTRRLVYIVNRRTVVDRATDDAQRLLGCIYRSGERDRLPWATDEAIAALGLNDQSSLPDENAPTVAARRTALAALSGDDTAAPAAVRTLRGELADNGEWKVNPARPAIIIGTVDMIGSKLLFSGYGDGRYGRAHHAGLIGQDALIVHDEAHLSPAFEALLRNVVAEQARCGASRPIRVMSLSATTRDGQDTASTDTTAFGLADEDHSDPPVKRRLSASKQLYVATAEKVKEADEIAARALELGTSSDRVLVYVRSPPAWTHPPRFRPAARRPHAAWQ